MHCDACLPMITALGQLQIQSHSGLQRIGGQHELQNKILSQNLSTKSAQSLFMETPSDKITQRQICLEAHTEL